MHTIYNLVYLPDTSVDTQLDQVLRQLLSLCFTGPEDHVFATQRFFKELPQHRWLVYETDQHQLVAQTAVHEKTLRSQDKLIKVGGIAEVCVHPGHRRQGLVKLMLEAIELFLKEKSFPFAVLFGREQYYQSSGFAGVDNIWYLADSDQTWLNTPWGRVKKLGDQDWPQDPVYLDGPLF